MLLLLCAFPIAHAPQFTSSNVTTLKHSNEVSQAIYFKGTGSVRIDDPKPGKLIQASFTNNFPVGTLFVGCDGAAQQVQLISATGTSEPFTQTTYFTKYDSEFPTCVSSFTLHGTFHEPWTVVVGKKERFSAWELLAFPIFSAKLHGSWWNQRYVYHWIFLVVLAAIAVFAIIAPHMPWGRIVVATLFFVSAADRLTHAWTPVIFADILPGLFVLFPNNCTSRWGWRLLNLLAIVSLLAFGSTYIINWLIALILVFGFWFPRIGYPLACLFLFGSGYILAPISLLLLNVIQFITAKTQTVPTPPTPLTQRPHRLLRCQP